IPSSRPLSLSLDRWAAFSVYPSRSVLAMLHRSMAAGTEQHTLQNLPLSRSLAARPPAHTASSRLKRFFHPAHAITTLRPCSATQSQRADMLSHEPMTTSWQTEARFMIPVPLVVL